MRPAGAESSASGGNKRVAYLALLEFLARNGIGWVPPSVDETVAKIERVAAGEVSERELADWLRAISRKL